MKTFNWVKPQMLRRANNHGEGVRHHNDAPAPDMKKARKVINLRQDAAIARNLKAEAKNRNPLEAILVALVNDHAAYYRHFNGINQYQMAEANRKEEERILAGLVHVEIEPEPEPEEIHWDLWKMAA